ncbi:MAG: YhdH/YhfP family quinone oxidoreductase [Deltaproteobacteria bacterium]|nr:YhdH/YhfP family quinone oxidoreductase [Deltaproteobacteria bacterium]
MTTTLFRALVVSEKEPGSYTRQICEKSLDDLPAGEVLIRVDYSSLNYKDALSATGNRGVTRKYPHTPGIDAAGVVVRSAVKEFRPGHEVLACGYDLGMNTPGGFGRYIRVPAAWVMHKPSALTLHACMQLGTAGFTAAQSVFALLGSGMKRADGPILVTGATGGVGSIAVALLARLGFVVTAVTGKAGEHDFLRRLGAAAVLNRKQATGGMTRMLLRERWAGVVDTVGGDILATAIKATKYDGRVTCCGNAASGELPISVYPFILRGVQLLGIDSARCPMARRKEIWRKLGGEWYIPFLEEMTRTISLPELDAAIDRMLRGGIRGRIVVDLQEGN